MSRATIVRFPFAFIALCIALAVLPQPLDSQAQTVTRRDVPKGGLSGLEMAVDGSMRTAPGGQLRWFVTVYEIVKGRDLRPASGVKLEALASFHRQEPVATATTDARGRASLIIDVPEDLEEDFNLVVQARSPKGVKRNFDVQVALAQKFRTELFVERRELPLGGELRVWGRITNLATMKPAVKHEVDVHVSAHNHLVGKRHMLTSNGAGFFEALLHAPKVEGDFLVSATAEDAVRVVRSAKARSATSAPLIVTAQPTVLVTTSGSTLDVDVRVRTPDGRPVPRATLSGLSIPVAKKDSQGNTIPLRPILTDSQGRARVKWEVRSGAALANVKGKIFALREGIGTGEGSAEVRVAREPVLVSWAVEGGALIPGLPSRVIIRAAHPDGSPWSALPVKLSGGRLKAAGLQTDKDGAATFEITVGQVDPDAPPSCKGPTLAAATLKLGQHTRSLCIQVDPDSTMRVRAKPRVRAGSEIEIQLQASSSVARLPVAITMLGRSDDGRWTPLAQKTVGRSQNKVRITLPPEARGAVWIRARPLLGSTLQPIRGGSAMVWAEVADPLSLQLRSASSGKMQLATSAKQGTRTGFVVALPAQEGRELLSTLRKYQGNRPKADAGDAEWMGFLAAQTPIDRAVSAVLRSGKAMSLAMPANSVAMGLLRDPWRTRSRFVRGRLGRLMLAVENHVSESLPESLKNVAVRGSRGWRFNSEILTVMANEMGIDAVAGLDGDPMSIANLQSLAPEFIYDNLARRLTRERLMRILIGMRQFVKSEQLDYQWARRGDPKTWLSGLLDWNDMEGEFEISREQMYDGWGKPFAIRKARGGRARFKFLEPIVGYEIISAGPDGRFGSSDDVYDPFARVLGKKSTYGEAVGEEALLARLKGVELGRATITALSEVFELQTPFLEATDMHSNQQAWRRPARLRKVAEALQATAVGDTEHSSSALGDFAGTTMQLKVGLSPEPRRYLVVAGVFTANGLSAFDETPLHAGAPLLIDASMPPRLRPKEVLQIPLHLIGLDRAQELTLSATGTGPVQVEIVGPKRLSLGAGESKTLRLRVIAKRVGRGTIHLSFKAADGSWTRKFQHTLPVMWGGSLRAQHSGILVTEDAKLSLTLPAKASPLRSFLVVSTGRDILRDPGFTQVRERYPELLAWSHVMRGEALPKSLADALSRSKTSARSMPTLLSASAALAWSATKVTPEIHATRFQSIRSLRSLVAPDSLRERSALLVALASGASAMEESDSDDPVTALVNRLRNEGWHAPRTEKSRPTLMARLAAGLLLADSEDMAGRKLFDLARAELEPGAHGGKTLVGEKGSEVDAWIGTLALAIAARQLGEESILKELVGSVARRSYLGMQGSVEPAFWLLAASAYGVFGVEKATEVSVSVEGKSHRLTFRRGVAKLSLPKKWRLGRAQEFGAGLGTS